MVNFLINGAFIAFTYGNESAYGLHLLGTHRYAV